MSSSEGESIEEESRRIEKRSDTRVINGVVHPPIHPSIRLAKGNGCNKRMIRPIYTYFQSVITDPCTGIWYGKKRRRRTGEESGEKTGQQRGWLALGLLAGRDAMFNWQLFSLAHRNRSEGGETWRRGGLLSLVCACRARRERSRRRREQRGIPVGGCQWWRGAWLGQRVVPRKGDAEWERTGHGGTDKGSDAGSDGIHDRTQHVKRCSPRNGGSGSSSTTTTTILSMKLPFPCFANNAHLSLCRERERERERESEGGRQQDWLVRYGRSSG